MPEDVPPDGVDSIEDPRAARDGGADLEPEAAGKGAREPVALVQQAARSLAFEGHEARPALVGAPCRDGALVDAESPQVLLRDVDTSLAPIHFDVLPEVDLLQRRADRVG